MSLGTFPRLHLIGPLDAVSLSEYVDIAVAVSARTPLAIHLRTPGIGAREMLTAARALRQRLSKGSILIVNDRVDVALLAKADGVQLGEASFTVNDARALSSNMLVGRSVHDEAGACGAGADGADFVLAGHIFATPSKPDTPGRGIAWLSGIVSVTPIPVVALGGITVERIAETLTTGAWGVALGRELLHAASPATDAERANQQIEKTVKETTHVAAH